MRKNQKLCPLCDGSMHRQSARCHKCAMKDPLVRQHLSEIRKGKPSYERTPEWRENMSRRMKGKKKGYPSASTRPEVAAKIQAWWTPERKEAKRQEVMQHNPQAIYHGLSCKGARRLREAVGRCEKCGQDDSESHLDIHHRNGNKHDQKLENLIVLCHRCHMDEHREEIGWAAYHKKKERPHGQKT